MKCAAFVQGLTPLGRSTAIVMKAEGESKPKKSPTSFDPEWKAKRPYSIAQALDQIYAGYGDNGQAEDTLQVKMQMGLDHKYPDQQIRFQVELPNGSGSERRVAVFCPPEEEQEMLDLGAKLAGKTLQDALLEETFDFDVLITKPQSMPAIAKLGKVLGPKRLMPSPKSGTVVTDMEAAIAKWKHGGTTEIRNNPDMQINVSAGRIFQGKEKLVENITSLLQQMADMAPKGAKKVEDYWRTIHLSTNKSPQYMIDDSEKPSHGFIKRLEGGMDEIAIRMGILEPP